VQQKESEDQGSHDDSASGSQDQGAAATGDQGEGEETQSNE
jgi:hypothetical protein